MESDFWIPIESLTFTFVLIPWERCESSSSPSNWLLLPWMSTFLEALFWIQNILWVDWEHFSTQCSSYLYSTLCEWTAPKFHHCNLISCVGVRLSDLHDAHTFNSTGKSMNTHSVFHANYVIFWFVFWLSSVAFSWSILKIPCETLSIYYIVLSIFNFLMFKFISSYVGMLT